MEYEYSYGKKRREEIFSLRLKAGKRRTYFFDVLSTQKNDFFICITESCRRANNMGFDRHKLYLYKEDFNKFHDALNQCIGHVKEKLLPEYDYDEYAQTKTELSRAADPTVDM